LPYSFTGLQNLLPDTNYFWLVYAVNATATQGDIIDGEAPSVTVDNIVRTVAAPAPSGNAVIRQEYCFSPSSSSGKCIDTAIVGGLFNATGVVCGTTYNNYPASGTTTTSIYAGTTVPVRLTFTSATKVYLFIDLNKNGIWEAADRFDLTAGGGSVSSISTAINIPSTAGLGETRMRIRTFGGPPSGSAPTVSDSACGAWNNSETEDYTITILAAIPPATYTWNQTAPADFNTAANWTPARSAVNENDRLIFGPSATALVVNNVTSQTVKSLEIAQGAKVTLNASTAGTLIVKDTLTLNDSAWITANANLVLQLGTSSISAGKLLQGNVTGLDLTFKRWTSGVGNLVAFPLASTTKGLRRVEVNYTVAPIANGSLTVSFVPTKANGSAGFPIYDPYVGVMVNKTCNEGYWNIIAGDGLSGGLYTANFYADSILGVSAFNLTVANRVDAFSSWMLNGNGQSMNGSLTNAIITRTNMQNFGQFAVAGDSVQNSLPVRLLNFRAQTMQEDVMVSWTTASELNNRGFENPLSELDM
jgi:hypothetical protein